MKPKPGKNHSHRSRNPASEAKRGETGRKPGAGRAYSVDQGEQSERHLATHRAVCDTWGAEGEQD